MRSDKPSSDEAPLAGIPCAGESHEVEGGLFSTPPRRYLRGIKMSIFDLFKKIESESATRVAISHIIVGLGNPGEQYSVTRHNAGFMAIDYLCSALGVRVDRVKFNALVGEAQIGEHRVLLMKPQTYMNASGKAVSEAANFYKIAPENVIVISDDITLDVGKMRIRRKGSAGGHNGLKSIIEYLNTDTFPRLKLGVGKKPHPEYDVVDWVLGKFSKQELETLSVAVKNSPEAVSLMLQDKYDEAMQRFN